MKDVHVNLKYSGPDAIMAESLETETQFTYRLCPSNDAMHSPSVAQILIVLSKLDETNSIPLLLYLTQVTDEL